MQEGMESENAHERSLRSLLPVPKTALDTSANIKMRSFK
jgi:hypothetical protein